MAETVTGFRGFREFRSAVPTFLTEDVLRDSQDGQVSGIRFFDEKNSLIFCPFARSFLKGSKYVLQSCSS